MTRGRIYKKVIGYDFIIGKVIIVMKIVMPCQIAKNENLIKILKFSWNWKKTLMGLKIILWIL